MAMSDDGPSRGKARAAIITPYYPEPPEVLARCLASVAAQTVPTDHIVVADGAPQELPDAPHLRHIILDRNHNNDGNTPRAIGGLLAVGGDYEAIAFLDADNTVDPDHIEAALARAAALTTPVDLIITQRRILRLDGTLMPLPPDNNADIVDTNCYVFLPGSYHKIAWWGSIPRPMSRGADRLFNRYLGTLDLVAARVAHPTVNYTCQWAGAYRALGEEPPPGAKDGVGDKGAQWRKSLSERELQIVERRVGLTLLRRGD